MQGSVIYTNIKSAGEPIPCSVFFIIIFDVRFDIYIKYFNINFCLFILIL